MSRIPVLIAARNEAECIGQTLDSLTCQAEPIVIPNGCTDKTAEIAEKFGATIIETEVEGKLSAIQAGIRHLGRRALEPFVTLDADSQPAFPRYWLDSLLEARYHQPVNKPAIATGGLIFRGGTSAISSLYRTIRSFEIYWSTRDDPHNGPSVGANMLIDPVTFDALEGIQELPQIWPGEDAIIKDVIIESGGGIRRSTNPLAMVLTDSVRYPGLKHRLAKGRHQSGEDINQSYLAEAPPESITGSAYRRQRSIGRVASLS